MLLAALSAHSLADKVPSPELSLPDVRKFLTAHCVKCHGPEKQKGKLRLDTQDPANLAGDSAAKWQAVYDRIVLGEMPAEDRPRPETGAQLRVLDGIAGALRSTGKFDDTASAKLKLPQHGNRVDHDTLFSGRITAAAAPDRDGIEMLHKFADSPRVRQAFVRHAFRYWMGRNETLADSASLIAADNGRARARLGRGLRSRERMESHRARRRRVAEGRKISGVVPDEYAAWSWRSYHSACIDVKITGPKFNYQKRDGKWGGPDCGLGYGGALVAKDAHTFSAKVTGDYAAIEFHDGNRIVGEAKAAPWTVEGVKLAPGLRVLFAVSVRADGTRAASDDFHPANKTISRK